LMEQEPTAAAALLREGAEAPANLGEGRHPANSMAERLVALGDALERAGDGVAAREAWAAARGRGNALAVDSKPVGPADYWRGVACMRLGDRREADRIWGSLEDRAADLEAAPAAPDYFATSLPELLLFDTDSAESRGAAAASLRQLASHGRLLGRRLQTKEEVSL